MHGLERKKEKKKRSERNGGAYRRRRVFFLFFFIRKDTGKTGQRFFFFMCLFSKGGYRAMRDGAAKMDVFSLPVKMTSEKKNAVAARHYLIPLSPHLFISLSLSIPFFFFHLLLLLLCVVGGAERGRVIIIFFAVVVVSPYLHLSLSFSETIFER